MDTATIKAPGAGAKPAEATPQRETPAANGAIDKKNLTPAGVSSLLSTEFAKQPEAAPTGEAKKSGEEVQPEKKAEIIDKAAEPKWSDDKKAWFELRAKATTPEEIEAADAQAPEFTAEEREWIEANPDGGSAEEEVHGGTLPEHLEAELAEWEKTGGTLPASLQKLVEKKIGKVVGEREAQKTRADKAEAEVARLNGELQQASQQQRPTAGVGGMDEKKLSDMVTASEKFRADARAFIGDYADEATAARIQKHMETAGLDDKGLRRQLDEVNDWLTQGAPKVQAQLRTFNETRAKIEPVVKSRFPTIGDVNTPEGKTVAEIGKFLPELTSRSPAAKFSLGVYALGMAAWEHLGAASKDGDVIAALRTVLKKNVPLPDANGKTKLFLPGKKPPGAAPRAGSPGASPRGTRKDAQEAEASEKLKSGGTAEDMAQTVAAALKVGG